MIGARLDHPGGNGADADGGAELDADPCFGVAVLEVVDELRDVLDGVDVVMRRRTDEPDPGRGVADPGDVVVHLAAGQLAPFAWLRALDDFDLQFVGIGQVVGGDAETPTCHLLDRRALRVAVGERDEAFGVLAAFTGIGLAADAVHGDRETLVGLLGDRTEAHGTGGEALDDLLGGLDVVERHRTAVGVLVEPEQPAQSGIARADVVGLAGEAPIRVLVLAARRNLQVGDGLRIPHVGVAVAAPVEVAGVGKYGQRHGLCGIRVGDGEADRVAALHLVGEHVETDALHAARGARETAFDHVVGQPHRLEDLGALVRLQGGDAHLGHHFQHALANALLVGIDHVGVVRDVVCIGQVAVAARIPQRLEGEVGIDRVGAEADQQAVVMDLACLAGLHD